VTFLFYPINYHQRPISVAGVFQPVPFPPLHFSFQMSYSKETMKMNDSNILEQSEQEFLWTNITFKCYSIDFFRVHIAYRHKDYVSR
jgi:hypothetical protein